MNLNVVKYVYLLGAGGIGMSALARYFHNQELLVCGYDRTETGLTRLLEKEGIHINYQDNEEAIPAEIRNASPENLLVIYTPAIPSDSIQKRYFTDKGYALVKRSEVLGYISGSHPTVAVAGTHGKTTTSTMIAHLFMHAGLNPVAFMGGISGNYNTNYLSGQRNAPLIAEADEYDRSFLKLKPQTAVITSVDADHLDIYGNAEQLLKSFADFARLVPDEGHLVMKAGLPLPEEIAMKAFTYHPEENADTRLLKLELKDGKYRFDVECLGEHIPDLTLGMPGMHNVENALAAITIARLYEIDSKTIREALSGFKGVKRRFEYIVQTKDFVFIDDYAHHPRELNACIQSVKALYPGKHITGVFQPHLYSRTRDFYQEFADSLSLLDTVILLDIYPARELPVPGVSSGELLKRIQSDRKWMSSKEELPALLESLHPEVLLTLGAGDIDQLVEPISHLFTRKSLKHE